MDLKAQAQHTVACVERGDYLAPSGARVELAARVEAARRGTRLYRPGEPASRPGPGGPPASPRFEVTPETTGAAARRCVVEDGVPHVALLNYASAKNPGGGFLGGAKAQEEDLARSSALYHCQLTQPQYYAANRADGSLLYTDHLIYSPEVPFFRGEDGALLEVPFTAAVVTSPAPNAGEHLARHPSDHASVRQVLERRAAQVLEVMRAHGHRTIVLGAWGCGVFRNDPAVVADVFAALLAPDRLGGAFDRVVLAVFARPRERRNLEAFLARFGSDDPVA